MYRFVNFKGFADATLDLRTPVTILIGRNGAGKSNAVEALTVLGAVVDGTQINEMLDIHGPPEGLLRGGILNAVRAGCGEFGLGVASEVDGDSIDYHFTIKIQRVQGRQVPASIVDEQLSRAGRQLLNCRTRGKGILRVKFDGSDGKVRQINVPASAAVVVDAAELGTLPASTELQLTAKHIGSVAKVPMVLDADPKAMRDYSPGSPRDLVSDASNVATVLWHMTRPKTGNPEGFARILAALRELPEEPFHTIRAIRTVAGDCTFGLADERDNISYGARLISDGTLRTLAVLTALETADSTRVLAIEEFDNGIHPSRAKKLVGIVFEAAQRRGLKVVLTTHNPSVLNALTRDQMNGVVLCWWDEATKASKLSHLVDLPDPDSFLAPGHLGEDVTKEVYRSHLISEEEYAEKRRVGVAQTIAWLRESHQQMRGEK